MKEKDRIVKKPNEGKKQNGGKKKPKNEENIEKKTKIPIDINSIRNKTKRRMLAANLLAEKKKKKNEARKLRKEKEKRGEHVERKTPRTIESMRVFDETFVDMDDKEIQEENEVDEFSDYFSGKKTPKLMITTCKRPSAKMYNFLKEIILIIPNAFYYKKEHYKIKSIIKYASKYEFTDLLIFNEHMKKPSGLYICHLPNGPTSYFKMTNVKLAQDMKGSAVLNDYLPEIILNNFNTLIGYRISRQLAALFPQSPEFTGRRVITFHNQRDFIFFRQHRYIFRDNGKKCCLQEIGPRFTLKLRWLQEGTFDTTGGKFEFIWRPDLQVDRKRMFI